MGTTEVYKATEQCALCKGACCKRMACHYSPDDFPEISYEYLKKEIEKGKISIDWWEDIFPEYYLRARHVGEPVVCGSWGGKCVNLTEHGCSLPFEERPLGGKALRPREHSGGDCVSSYKKEQCKNDWKQYSSILEQLVMYFRSNPIY